MLPVYVTGMGVASGLGATTESLWSSILQCRSSVRVLDLDSSYRSRIAATVNYDELQFPDSYNVKIFNEPCIRYAVHAAYQAIKNAKLLERDLDKKRIGVIISTGIGGISTIEDQYTILKERGPSRISPYFVPNAIANASSGLVSMLFGFHGMNTSLSSACSSSTQAIGIALRLIQAGDMDICVVGGSEHATTASSMAGFSAQRALSTSNDAPQTACRPWDRDRNGFVIGDGAAVLVLERSDIATQAYAEIVDVGWSSDAFHPVQPEPNGLGAKIAMQNAMRSLKDINCIDYINAHATGTALGDLIELNLIKDLWQNYHNIHMSSTKSMHAHLLGAAGALEALITILAINNSVLPPTINCPNPIMSDINLVNNGPERKNIRYALSNSFGFGGTNATLLFKKI